MTCKYKCWNDNAVTWLSMHTAELKPPTIVDCTVDKLATATNVHPQNVEIIIIIIMIILVKTTYFTARVSNDWLKIRTPKRKAATKDSIMYKRVEKKSINS